MKKLIRKLQCWWRGHVQNPYFGDHCENCDELVSYEDFVNGGVETFFWRIKQRIRYGRVGRLINRFKKCPDCGRRFKCDETQDHIPF